jgi:hypothetical protein
VKETCYMCDATATSREHVPPKCLFPEQKDLPGTDLRRNLITVPACDEHNLKKSDDDQFLMVSLAGVLGNNAIGYGLRFTKIDRAARRSAGRVLRKVFTQKHAHAFLQLADSKFVEIVWGTPDQTRLENCFRHIAHALHFHHFGSRFVGNVRILLGHLSSPDENYTSFVEFIRAKVSAELAGRSEHGENLSVFSYQFTDQDGFGLRLIRLRFYQNVEVYVSMQPADVEIPTNMAMLLVERGVPTTIHDGGVDYRFNTRPVR